VEGIKRRHLGSEAWRELFRRHAAGGESASAFCQREGVSAHSFRRWRARLGEEVTAASTRVVAPMKARATPAAAFVELGALDAAPPVAGRMELRLDLGGGVTLHVVRG
jgi:hypothetical protein